MLLGLEHILLHLYSYEKSAFLQNQLFQIPEYELRRTGVPISEAELPLWLKRSFVNENQVIHQNVCH